MKLNKKGFTLVELLAVIVVLGLVTVIGATTVLPLLGKSQKNALATEANLLAESASQAVSLISIGSYDDGDNDANKTNYTKYANDYCFTLEQLKAAGLWKKKDSSNYKGYVYVQVNGNSYTYYVSISNDKYATNGEISGTVDVDDIKEVSATQTLNCPSTQKATTQTS